MFQSITRKFGRPFTMFRTLVAAIVLLNIVAAERAAAQGTSGTLPDPVTTEELKDYAERLKLSPQQMQAAQMMHDQYKQEFRALRNGEIAEFLKDMRSMQSGGMMPKREVIESFLKKADQLNGKIAAIDNRLFDQMQTILTDDQLVRMPRVRLARQRTRYAANQMMWITGNRAVDLSEIVMKLDVAPDQFQAIDPVMGQYEGKLTSTISKLYDKSTKMILNMFDSMTQMGFTEDSMNDPETAQKMMEAMQKLWRDMTMEVVQLNSDLGELNQRTYKTIAPILSPDVARKLREQFFSRAYPEAGFGFGSEQPFFTAALKLELTDDQRQGVAAIRDDLQRKLDHIVDDTVTLIDKSRGDFTPFDYGSEKMKDYQQKLTEFQTAMADARKSAVQAVDALIGPELAQKIDQKFGPHEMEAVGMSGMVKAAVAKAQKAQADAKSSDDKAPDEENDDAPSWNGDQKVPAAISRRDLNDYLAILQLNDDDQAIARQLHASYLEKYKAVQDKEIAALTSALSNQWHFDEATQTTTGPSADQIEQIQRLRRAAIDAVHRVDNGFFDDLGLTMASENASDKIERIRHMRERACFVQDPNAIGWWMGGSSDSAIDLSRFARHQKLSDADLAAIDPELIAYEKVATDAFRARFDASLAVQQAQEQWQAGMANQATNAGEAAKAAVKYQNMMGEVTKRMNDASAAVSKLNRETIAKLLPRLSDDGARTLRNAFNRRAYPDIYNDALALEQQLTSALKLDNLSAEQRQRLNEVAAEYRPAYSHFCDEMVDLGSVSMYPMTSSDRDDWKKWQEKQEQLETLKFDRSELNQRTMSKLRALLSEDQIRRIGGLPESKKETAMEE